MTNYHPNGPYVFKSGKRAGQSLEILVFQDYPFLSWLLREHNRGSPNAKKNSLHLHLEWLLNKGENRVPIKMCPVCKQDRARYFFVRHFSEGILVDTSYLSCDKQECINEIVAMGMDIFPERRELKFSSLNEFKRGDEKKALAEMYKKIFLPPGKLSREKAFGLFIS